MSMIVLHSTALTNIGTSRGRVKEVPLLVHYFLRVNYKE